MAILLIACGASSPPSPSDRDDSSRRPSSTEDLLDLAATSSQPLASEYLISAAELLIMRRQFERARDAITGVAPIQLLDETQKIRLAIVRADLSLEAGEPAAALNQLDSMLTDGLSGQTVTLQRQVLDRRTRALVAEERFREAAETLIRVNAELSDIPDQGIQDLIWLTLQNLSERQLSQIAAEADSYELRGWVELVRTMRSYQYSVPRQVQAISRWQSVWTRHSAGSMLPHPLAELDTIWNNRPRHIALLLPLQEQIGRAVQEGFLSAYYQALEEDGIVPNISVYDTSGISEIRGLYETAVESGASLVIGPLNKELVRQLDNLSSLPVPTLALNYTDFDQRTSEEFFQFGLAPEDEIRRVARRAWNSGYRNAAIVAPDSLDYLRLQETFSRIWRSLGGNVVSSVSFAPEGEYADTVKRLLAIDASEDRAARIEALLPRSDIEFIPRRRSDIDFIFLMANPRQGRQINPTLAFYFAGDLPVFALSAINDGTRNQLVNQDLNGIVFTDTPWVLRQQDPLRQQVNASLRATQGPLQRLRALGVDSFRIYPWLNQLASGELINFKGATGWLSMNAGGIIGRVPETAMFVDGLTNLLEDGDDLENL